MAADLTFTSDVSLRALMITTLAGLSTALGAFVVFFSASLSMNTVGYMLSFASGVMLYLSFLDILPEAMEHIGFMDANLSFFVGVLMFFVIERFVPEPDMHGMERTTSSSDARVRKRNPPASKPFMRTRRERAHLLQVGVLTALSISLHNFPEGVAVYLSSLKGLDLGIPLALAIAAHNIPEGMAVASPIYHSTGSAWQAFKWTFLSGFCEPLGATIVGYLFSDQLMQSDRLIHQALAAVSGIMVAICLKELIPTSLKYISPMEAAYANFIGMIVIFVTVVQIKGVMD